MSTKFIKYFKNFYKNREQPLSIYLGYLQLFVEQPLPELDLVPLAFPEHDLVPQDFAELDFVLEDFAPLVISLVLEELFVASFETLLVSFFLPNIFSPFM